MGALRKFVAWLTLVSMGFAPIAQAQSTAVGILLKSSPSVIVTSPPYQSNLIFWLDPSDLSTMFQTITGTTAVAADGDVVGTWKDKSSSAFDLAAIGNDTSRPTFHVSGSLYWVEGDGSNDTIYRAGTLGLYALSGYTVVAGVRANPAADKWLLSEGYSAFPGANIAMLRSEASTASTMTYQISRDDASRIITETAVIKTGVWDNTDKVVAVSDSTTAITPYVDGVVGTPYTYSRSGTVTTFNRFGLFGYAGAGCCYDQFAARVYCVLVYNRVLNAAEVKQASRYCAYRQGRRI